MLAMVLMMAMAAGGDEASCSGHSSAAYEIELVQLEAEAYADAEFDFAARFEELGLVGSTLGRAEALAVSVAKANDGDAADTIASVLPRH